ncbi:MAG: trigger factor [Ruminococcaceae bacterium]|nr:trigger factor [Oscillospiraceae bacterium]
MENLFLTYQRRTKMAFTYLGLKANYQRHMVTESEVDRHIERLQQQYPRIAVVTDRPTENGDEIVLDYAGFCEGVQFAGGTAEMQTLVLGSGMFIPGFEEQLLDKVPGEEVTVKVTFPEQYHSEELAGKAAEFKCKIHEIRVKTPYELDDVFAKEVGDCDTFPEMKEKLRESLQSYTDGRGEMDLQDRLLRAAAETLDYTPTEGEIEEAVQEQMNNLRAQLSQQGLTLDMYMQFMNTTEAALREEAEPTAIAALRTEAAIDRIVELEGLTATQEEIADMLAIVCQQNDMTMEQIQEYYDAELEAAIRRSVLTGKAMGLIRDAAVITEV